MSQSVSLRYWECGTPTLWPPIIIITIIYEYHLLKLQYNDVISPPLQELLMREKKINFSVSMLLQDVSIQHRYFTLFEPQHIFLNINKYNH